MSKIMTRGKTIIIQGGQYGSEGKGQIAAFIAGQRNVWAAVRTGSINAGHTVYKDGKKFVMQIIPTAWIHPNVVLVLGAGCYIEPAILAAEVEMIRAATGEDIRRRLWIDCHCTWFGTEQQQKSEAAGRHHAMGATGKGCSEAIKIKMDDRGGEQPAYRLFKWLAGDLYQFGDTVAMLNHVLEDGSDVLLEGTQGALLDFNTGPYPYVTSRMTNAPAWLAEAGLPPVNVETILVLRSHPIRVAGNSGPMPGEISWPMLARLINETQRALGKGDFVDEDALRSYELVLDATVCSKFPTTSAALGARATFFHEWTPEEKVAHRVCLSEANRLALNSLSAETLAKLKFFEMTTVTKKLRRIATFNLEEARRAIAMNGPTSVAYTFLNYDRPDLWGERDLQTLLRATNDFTHDMSGQLGVPVRYVSTERYQDTVIDLHS